MARIHMRGYVPDGEDAYTSVVAWWQLPLMLLGLGALCVPIAFRTRIPALVAAVATGVLAVTVTVLWLRRLDRAGVHLAIDQRGVYYGTPPGAGPVPWVRITQVFLGLEGDNPWAADALRLRVCFTATAGGAASGGAGERVTVIGKAEGAVAQAVTRYAPAHVHLTGILAPRPPSGDRGHWSK